MSVPSAPAYRLCRRNCRRRRGPIGRRCRRSCRCRSPSRRARKTAFHVRRDKAALSSGCKAHPATAPAGSNRGRHGGEARGQNTRGHTATQGSKPMDPFARRRLGLTAVEVTQLGFGGAGLGDLFEVIPEAQAAATLEAAWDAGIRYYDTAPWYGLTQSEHRFGRALYRQPRRDFVLSTKVGRTMHAVHHAETYDRGIWTGGLPFQVRFDYSYDGVMRSFEDSLQRLGLPRIDLLLVHDLDIQYHQTYKRVEALLIELHNGGARALAELRAAGRISGFGAGINELGMIPRFLDLIDVDFFLVALPYTLLNQ